MHNRVQCTHIPATMASRTINESQPISGAELLLRNRRSSAIAERRVHDRQQAFWVANGCAIAEVRRTDTAEMIDVPFPKGSSWPGENEAISLGLEIVNLRLAAGSQTIPLESSPRDIERGKAHLTAVVLARSSTPTRAAWLLTAVNTDLRENNNEISGLMVNATRKNYRNRDQRFPGDPPEGLPPLPAGGCSGKIRNRQIPGPEIEEAFVVLQGAAVIEGEIPITLTAGSVWPGAMRLGTEDPVLQPCAAWLATGTVVSPWLSDRDIDASKAMIQILMLSRMDNRDCIRYLGESMQRMSLESNASIIGASPDNLRRILTDMSRAGDLNWRSFNLGLS